ncbi:hypothetical protein AC579_1453 [Pseudocercospora musae]|uniref:Uncharacterized protein n=1 Tax=Pseudocercospora musae TaxID=113226 RepID=A0A139IMA4_9PEZI|nr:hypothetical protein AC579_1453 [Pseudocercospora musae]
MPGSKNTYDPNTDIPDLSGKVFVVTRGSAGIGFASAPISYNTMLPIQRNKPKTRSSGRVYANSQSRF